MPILVLASLSMVPAVSAGASGASPSFTNVPLVRPEGDTEPAITIGADGTTVVSGLNIASGIENYFTNGWKGPFGSSLGYQGPMDAFVGKAVGGDDADVDLGSTGTLHATTLGVRFNPKLSQGQLVITSVTCLNADTSNSFSNCRRQIIDNAGTDRPFVTSDGRHVYIAYHDAGSGAIRVQRSDDDGLTWKKYANVIVGHGTATGTATFNNGLGPIVADPTTHMVFEGYSGGPKQGKGQNFNHNLFYVARSSDLGNTWKTTLAFQAPVGTNFDNPFPGGLAVDPTNGAVYASFGDGAKIYFTRSLDHGVTWSPVRVINMPGVSTALFPAVAAYDGQVDLVYYGTDAADRHDRSAFWNVFDARSTDGGSTFTQYQVTDQPNHWGPVCTDGDACPLGTRQLADLFEIAIDPRTGLAAIAYALDTLGHPFTITAGPNAGQYHAAEGGFTTSIVTLPHQQMRGPTTYVGTACTGEPVPPATDPSAIAVVLGSPCRFDVQAQDVLDAGYAGFVAFLPANNPNFVFPMDGNARPIPGVLVEHATGLAIFEAGTDADLELGESGAPISVGALRPQVAVAYEQP
jgi:hypothetical protein